MGTSSLPNALLAVDTNVPLDLADGKEHVLDAIAVIGRRLKSGRLLLTPTAFQELVYLADHAESAADRRLAANALRGLANWRIELVNLVPVQHGIVERIAQRVVEQGLLPAEEFNDALILAEAALLGCDLLLSSDAHLREIDFAQARRLVQGFDVGAPVITSPREIVKRFLPA